MKLFAAITGSLLVVILIVWGVCFAAHASKERDIVKRLSAAADEISGHDFKSESEVDLQDDQSKLALFDLEMRKATRSAGDPFWFVHNADDLP